MNQNNAPQDELMKLQDSEWVETADCLPQPDTEVLALFEMHQMEIGPDGDEELWPRNPYHYMVAKIELQFRTGKPMWVDAWEGELVERINFAVTHWMKLPELPQEEN
jgi:hypothetical protein